MNWAPETETERGAVIRLVEEGMRRALSQAHQAGWAGVAHEAQTLVPPVDFEIGHSYEATVADQLYWEAQAPRLQQTVKRLLRSGLLVIEGERFTGWASEDFEELLAEVREEARDEGFDKGYDHALRQQVA